VWGEAAEEADARLGAAAEGKVVAVVTAVSERGGKVSAAGGSSSEEGSKHPFSFINVMIVYKSFL
jgi:hypothetical protein